MKSEPLDYAGRKRHGISIRALALLVFIFLAAIAYVLIRFWWPWVNSVRE